MDLLCDAINFTSSPAGPRDRDVRDPTALFSHNPTSPPERVNRCHLCGRIYERADHLNRHLKSHENARPYKCTRCTKSFNRADLLNRHQAGHDRNAGVRIERSDRVSTACLACISSKTKCQDEKPCARCRRRNIACELAPARIDRHSRKGSSFEGGTGVSDALIDPSLNENNHESNSEQSSSINDQAAPIQETAYTNGKAAEMEQSAGNPTQVPMNIALPNVGSSSGVTFDNSVQDFTYLHGPTSDTGVSFMAPDSYFTQDLDFEMWDIDLDSVEFAFEHITNDPTPHLPPHSQVTTSNKPKDAAKRYAAFEKSPWLWTPTSKDQTLNDHGDLNLDEESIPSVLTPSSPATGLDDFASCCMNARIRDQMLGLLFKLDVKHSTKPLSFPSLELLNNLVQIYFVQESYKIDSFIHPASISPNKTLPQLYLAIIAQGSTLISTPAVWKMGFALQEVVRHSVVELWEGNNSNTRNLQTIQAFVMSLDIGLWSGFKRKMEIAESFAQPVLTMLRRSGAFTGTRISSAVPPERTDSEAVLESKWRKWAERESYKRLVLHLFIHDIHASIALHKPPLTLFTELKFALPASRELWLAKSATSWRDLYLSSTSTNSPPSLLDAMHNPEVLFQYTLQIDMQLTMLVLLHGFWGQIHSLLESRKFFPASKATHRLCLLTAHTELYRDLISFSAFRPSTSPRTTLISHLFMMVLHVSPEDLHRFAGKFGEDEARKASVEFQAWAGTAEARTGVWHAGQVVKSAEKLMPAQLRGFNAIALYYATLALWVYGLMASASAKSAIFGGRGEKILMNAEETAQVKDFRSSAEGIPGLQGPGEFVPLSAPSRILGLARQIYKSNFPVSDEGLPPLVENLSNLLRDLCEPGSRVSRAPSEGAI